MSNSTAPTAPSRVVRTHKPKGKLTKHNYRKRAITPLLADFESRCAYSMKHLQNADGVTQMEIDHFDPRLKTRYLQRYSNLFLATGHCNRMKGSNWPSPEDQARGIRFLDCCKERDYGEHIFEDPDTHEVFGVTSAGKYHVTILDLNAADLVLERKMRSEMIEALGATQATLRPGQNFEELRHVLALMQEDLKFKIPEIPFSKRAT